MDQSKLRYLLILCWALIFSGAIFEIFEIANYPFVFILPLIVYFSQKCHHNDFSIEENLIDIKIIGTFGFFVAWLNDPFINLFGTAAWLVSLIFMTFVLVLSLVFMARLINDLPNVGKRIRALLSTTNTVEAPQRWRLRTPDPIDLLLFATGLVFVALSFSRLAKYGERDEGMLVTFAFGLSLSVPVLAKLVAFLLVRFVRTMLGLK